MGKFLKLQSRFIGFALYAILLFALFCICTQIHFEGNSYIHSLLELNSLNIAFFTAILAFIHYYNNKNNSALFIAVAFVGAFLFDYVHFILTLSALSIKLHSSIDVVRDWSGCPSRLFLSLFFLFSILGWKREQKLGISGKFKANIVYFIVSLFFGLTLFTLLFAPLSLKFSFGMNILKEILPTILFLSALIFYFKKNSFEKDTIDSWIIFSLITNIFASGFFMLFSNHLDDSLYIMAHILKLFSYTLIFIGFIISVYNTFKLEKRNNKFIRSILDNIPFLVWLKDDEGQFIAVNEPFAKAVSKNVDEITGKNDFDFHPQDLAEAYRADDIEVMKTGKPKIIEEDILIVDERKWSETFKAPIYDENGEILGTTGFSRDITERKEYELELLSRQEQISNANKRELLLRRIIEMIRSSLDINYIKQNIVNEIGKAFNPDRCYIRLFNNDKDEFLPFDDYSEYLSPFYMENSNENKSNINSSDYLDMVQYLGSIIKKNKSVINENIVNFKTEDPILASIAQKLVKNYGIKSNCAVPIFYRDKLIGVLVCHYLQVPHQFSNEDIQFIKTLASQTGIALHQAELYSEIKRNEKYTRTILDSIKDGLVILNENCVIESCNPAISDMFGYSSSEIMGKKLNLLIPHACSNSTLDKSCLFENCFLNQLSTSKNEFSVEKKDGKVFSVELNRSEINFENKRATLLLIRDITQQKEVERLKNEFISTVSHELRTPLTSIRGSLGLVISGFAGEMPGESKEFVDIAYNNSARLINLINDILDIEKMEAGKMDFHIEVHEIMPLVDQSIKINIPYAQQFEVDIKISESIANTRVKVDKDRFIQVLTNLFSNAVKFSPKNSAVTISVTKNENNIRVSVSDLGSGISKEFQQRIFQKFAQADSSDTRQKGGTGLGLSISKSIIEKFDGKIGFTSEINKGTTFYVDLPEFIIQAPKISTEDSSTPHILICEDDKDIASLISILLKQEGYSTDIAYNAKQAKQLLSDNDYDALTVDLILPDENGISLIRELRQNKKTESIPIIVISVNAKEDNKDIESHCAILDWINKPIDQNKLINTVKRAIIGNNHDYKPNILHVEDDIDVQKIVFSIFKDQAFVSQVNCIKDAELILKEKAFDVVLLDLELPDGNGAELIPLINNLSKKMLIVIFSAHNVDESLLKNIDIVLLKSKTSNQDLIDAIKSVNYRKSK